MKKIPIVLTFDRNMSLPAAICISSMMQSAEPDTFYEYFILYSGDIPEIAGIDKIKKTYSNMSVTYRSVGDVFNGAYEIRGITAAAYYRLLAAELIPEYDKVIYADVDMIFRLDMAELYDCDLGDNYLGAVYALGLNTSDDARDYVHSIGLTPGDYFLSGFLLMNLAKIRRDGLTDKFVALAKDDFKYQDQDIMNIVCCGKISSLPYVYSMTVAAFEAVSLKTTLLDTKYMYNPFDRDPLLYSNIHYNGVKPWKDWCPNMDQWWECYRNSPIYDPAFYFSFFNNKLDYLDQLSLTKRIKILLRYFIFGQKKIKNYDE